MKIFGHALSLKIPGGEMLYQEVPRPVPIIRKEKPFCNVNRKENLVGGMAKVELHSMRNTKVNGGVESRHAQLSR
jgi:hypothetical protein